MEPPASSALDHLDEHPARAKRAWSVKTTTSFRVTAAEAPHVDRYIAVTTDAA